MLCPHISSPGTEYTLPGPGGSTLLFDLLAYLVRHRGVVLTREQLLMQVWGYEHTSDTRTVDVHVRWLRQKLEDDPENPELIQTVSGVGYRCKE